MAKADLIDVGDIAVAGVNIKRWWQSKEIINHIAGAAVTVAGLAAALAPIALPLIQDIGLTPRQLLTWVLILNAIIYGTGIVLKMKSTSLIGAKSDVAEAKAVAGVVEVRAAERDLSAKLGN